MNIILFSRKRGQVLNFEVNMIRLGASIALSLVLLSGLAFYGLSHQEEEDPEYVMQWQGVVTEQQEQIEDARRTALANLDALTMRIGQLQAQMLRLNALGERLVSKASFDRAEFNFDELPAMGGPQDAAGMQSVQIPDFLAMLEGLAHEMEDREQKLSVLETLLMDKSLRARVMPSGRPVESGWLSSKFGKRTDPFSGRQEQHKGIDFAGKVGTNVIAVGDGVVTWSGKRYGYGRLVEINHGNGYVTRYGHNQRQLVSAGDTVKKGQVIALMGSTGRSTGPHVHFEVLQNGKPVNPTRFIHD